MMRRDDQIGNGYRGSIFVLDGHLGFAVRIEALDDALLPYRGQTPRELMGKIDRRGHQLRIHIIETPFFGGITKHHALVAGALLFKQPLPCRDALGNIRALWFEVYFDLTGVSTKTDIVHAVADI